MEIANIDREILHILWTTWGNSKKFSGNICFKIILKVKKTQGFTHRGGQIDPPAVLGLNYWKNKCLQHSYKWGYMQKNSAEGKKINTFSKQKDS